MSASVRPDRYCPLCGAETDSRVCAADGTATLRRGAPPSDPSRIKIGDVIADRYRIEGELGRGGFGAVFRARHTGTGQEVGLKVLVSGADDTVKQRFFREARMTAQLRHPNTIRVFDFGQSDDGTLFIAMEMLRGCTVAEELEKRQRDGGAFSEQEAVEIGIAVADSLDEAHAAGLVHRDLKPHNLFLHEDKRDGRVVKVLDFGIAKGLGKSLTGDGILGTPTYMSPEQIRNLDLDGRSDVYALGVVLFYVVAGRPPFDADEPLVVMMEHTTKAPPRLADVAPDRASRGLNAVVARCLAKSPDDRFQDATELARALQTLNKGGRTGRYAAPRRMKSGGVVRRPSRRHAPVGGVGDEPEADDDPLPATVVGPLPTKDDELAEPVEVIAAPPIVSMKPNWPLRIAVFLAVSSVSAAIVVWGVLIAGWGADSGRKDDPTVAAATGDVAAPSTAASTAAGANSARDANDSADAGATEASSDAGSGVDSAAAAAEDIAAASQDNAAAGSGDADDVTGSDAVGDADVAVDGGAAKARKSKRRRSKRGRYRGRSRSRRKARKPRRRVIDHALEVEVN